MDRNHEEVRLPASIEMVVSGLVEGLPPSFGMKHGQINLQREECDRYLNSFALANKARNPVKQFLHYPRVIRGIAEAGRYLRLTKDIDRGFYETLSSWDSMTWVSGSIPAM